ncbi:hypothetical protein [Pseudoalteromonas sp. GB56]
MEDLTTDVDISFRFLNLNKLQAYTLAKEVSGATYKMPRNKNYYVGCIPLTEDTIHEINDFYVRQMVDISECDIFVSIVSEFDSNIVDVPAVVNHMLKYIDCKLTYSFTVV